MQAPSSHSTATTIGVSVAASGLLVAGVWALGITAPNVIIHGLSSTLWAGALAAAIMRFTPTSAARRAGLMALAGTGIVLVLALGALSQERVVNEQVVSAPQAVSAQGAMTKDEKGAPAGNTLVAKGRFQSLAHATSGTASVIRLPDGSQKLTLTGFKTDPGPDLVVIAAAGKPQADDDVKDFITLGRLKGTAGNQQYSLPKNFDATRNGDIYIWCRAFTVGFGKTRLA